MFGSIYTLLDSEKTTPHFPLEEKTIKRRLGEICYNLCFCFHMFRHMNKKSVCFRFVLEAFSLTVEVFGTQLLAF